MLKMSIFLAGFLIIVFNACEKDDSSVQPGANGDGDEERIVIVDNTGKEWDITHAVNHYDFQKSNFNFGLGPNAIQPINNPDMLAPGDDGYPDESSSRRVMGVEINGDARAYPVSVLSRREVVNEFIGDSHVAVAY